MQTIPGAQSWGPAQVELQLPVVVEQANGAQGRGPPAMQVPLPSQRLALICAVAFMQTGALPLGSQAKGAQVSTGPIRQLPLPSQAPAAVTLLPLQVPAAHWVPTG